MEKMVSVIIPVFNGEEFIERCIRSLMRQSYHCIEIICVDDGSTDKTAGIIRSLQDERIRLFSKENGGVSSARNFGIQKAQGEYLTFVDADDWVLPRYVEALVNGMVGADASSCGHVRVRDGDDSDVLNVDEPDHDLRIMNYKDYLNNVDSHYVCGKMVKRETAVRCLFSPELSFAEDRLWNLSLADMVETIWVTDQGLYCYFQREGSACHTRFSMIPFAKEALKLLEKAGTDNEYILSAAYRALLSGWYSAYLSFDKAGRREAKSLMPECRKYKCSTNKSKMRVLRLFSRFPRLYRLYRIATDRSLIYVEVARFKKMFRRS